MVGFKERDLKYRGQQAAKGREREAVGEMTATVCTFQRLFEGGYTKDCTKLLKTLGRG